jgi:hypothetical protein
MDKLELDDRVARLERRVSSHSALLAVILLIALGAIMLMFVGVRTESDAPPSSPAVEVRTITTSAPAAYPFETELRKARKLQLDGLISQKDFEAKKAMVLGMPMTFSDDIEAMKAANALKDEGVLTGPEYDAMKRKILKLAE